MNSGRQSSTEIHFHKQEEASVYFESTEQGDAEDCLLILTFASFAVRQIILSSAGTKTSLVSFLEGLSQIESEEDWPRDDEVKVIGYPGVKGRKSLLYTLELRGDWVKTRFKWKGFGLFSTGIEYYGPTAVGVLYRYCLRERAGHASFGRKLAFAAHSIPIFYERGKIGLGKDATVGTAAVVVAYDDVNEPLPELMQLAGVPAQDIDEEPDTKTAEMLVGLIAATDAVLDLRTRWRDPNQRLVLIGFYFGFVDLLGQSKNESAESSILTAQVMFHAAFGLTNEEAEQVVATAVELSRTEHGRLYMVEGAEALQRFLANATSTPGLGPLTELLDRVDQVSS